jgi:hypothetical protein
MAQEVYMPILDEIIATLDHEKREGNDLIGICYFTTKPAEEVIEGPFVRAIDVFSRLKQLIEDTEKELLICLHQFQSESPGAKDILDGIHHLKSKADKEHKTISVYIIINHQTPSKYFSEDQPQKSVTDEMNLVALNSDYFKIQFAYHKSVLFGSTHARLVARDNLEVAILTGDPTNSSTDGENACIEVATLCKDSHLCEGIRNHFDKLWKDATDKTLSTVENTNLFLQTHSAPANVVYLGKNPITRPYTNYHSPYKIALLVLLNQAKKNANVMISHLNDPDILNALLQCINRGVTVCLIVEPYRGQTAGSLPFAGQSNMESVQFLLKKISPTHRGHLNLHHDFKEDQLTSSIRDETIYANIVIVDNSYVLTGSSFMDKQSLRSGESDVLFLSSKLAKEYQGKIFEPLFNKKHLANNINVSQMISREQIKSLTESASSIMDITHILNLFIMWREQEKETHKSYGQFSHLWKETCLTREEKILAAKELLAVVMGQIPQHTLENYHYHNEGLLKDIYRTYQRILTTPEVNATPKKMSTDRF